MRQSVAIIGGGPAALALAAFLDQDQFEVTIYEKNKTLGRKFLVAGSGGFNLTHDERMPAFAERYTPTHFLAQALTAFTNDDLRAWLVKIGITTFVGSSKRVYPTKGIKPIQVLQALLKLLEAQSVTIKTQHQWLGWTNEGQLQFANGSQVQVHHTIFALGGGSWKVTGSDGNWLPLFEERGIKTAPFLAANCAGQINWPASFLAAHEGQPLKNISIRCGDQTQSGEAVITRFGLEGNALYALSPFMQAQLQANGQATVYMDLKPSLSEQEVLRRLGSAKGKKTSDTLRRVLKLSATQTQLLKSHLSKEQFLSLPQLAAYIKQLPLTILAMAPLDEAISTTGGIALSAVDTHYQLHQLPKHYCIGEMLDWNAPTGGYLLQACFSMGCSLALFLNGK